MKNVLLSHSLYKDGMAVLAKEVKTVVADSSDLHSCLDILKQVDGVVLRVGRIGRDIIAVCPRLKVISRPGVGVDNVDVQAATEYGIPVVIAPGANLRSVAEHTLALLYSITKNVVESTQETVRGNFSIRNKYAAVELKGKTLGIVGFGNIGKETARVGRNNEMNIIAYDAFVPKEKFEQYGYAYVESLDELLERSDFISLHVPATADTKKMLGTDQFKKMKAGAFLVNCARGDVVDEDALYEALKNGHLAGAAVDVMGDEPMLPGNKLFALPNFIATPHMAALTQEGAARTSVMAAEGTLAVLRGERWPHVVNPEVYQHERWK
jgi:D-3-phosphoglycerate dehydrogenase